MELEVGLVAVRDNSQPDLRVGVHCGLVDDQIPHPKWIRSKNKPKDVARVDRRILFYFGFERRRT